MENGLSLLFRMMSLSWILIGQTDGNKMENLKEEIFEESEILIVIVDIENGY